MTRRRPARRTDTARVLSQSLLTTVLDQSQASYHRACLGSVVHIEHGLTTIHADGPAVLEAHDVAAVLGAAFGALKRDPVHGRSGLWHDPARARRRLWGLRLAPDPTAQFENHRAHHFSCSRLVVVVLFSCARARGLPAPLGRPAPAWCRQLGKHTVTRNFSGAVTRSATHSRLRAGHVPNTRSGRGRTGGGAYPGGTHPPYTA